MTKDVSVYDIFKQIEGTSGKNDKVAIIKANASNVEFEDYLRFLYDETITTGLSSKKINKSLSVLDWLKEPETNFSSPLEVMSYISFNNTGTDKVISEVQTFLYYIKDEAHKEFLKQVFTKSYKCGITASSVNKALGKDFIKEFKVQLAYSFEKYADRVEGKEFWITKKLDGHRVLIEVVNGEVIFRTRKGHEILGLTEIKREIEKIIELEVSGINFVLDGEITVIDDSDPETVFAETSKVIRKDGEKTGLKFNWFDVVTKEDFDNSVSEASYEVRRSLIEETMIELEDNFGKSKFFEKVDVLYHGTETSEIAKWSDWATEHGFEGVMVNLDDPYVTKRTPSLLKVKKFHEVDILVKSVFEGTGKYTGSLGGIVVDYKGNDVSVGSGFVDSERDHLWNNPEDIIGKVVAVKFFEETRNQKDDSISLRFPIFKAIRTDKGVEDISYA